MAGTGGFFLQGLGEGLESGFNMGMRKKEQKWKEQKEKELEQKQKAIEDAALEYKNMVDEFTADKVLSNDEMAKLNAAYLAAGYEVQGLIKNTHNDIQNMHTKKVNQDFEMLDMWAQWTAGQSPENLDAAFNDIQKWIQTEEGKRVLEAHTNLMKRQQPAQEQKVSTWDFYTSSPADVQSQIAKSTAASLGLEGIEFQQPAEKPKELGVPDYNTVVSYLSKFTDPTVFEQQKATIQSKFGYDLSGITFESLQEPEKPKTETAKKSRINDLLFGDTGIIPEFIKEQVIDQGAELTAQDKKTILKNYNIKKAGLSQEEKKEIENYFLQIGIDVNAPEKVETEKVPEETSGFNLFSPATWTTDEHGFRKGQIKHDEQGNAWKYIGDGKWEKL